MSKIHSWHITCAVNTRLDNRQYLSHRPISRESDLSSVISHELELEECLILIQRVHYHSNSRCHMYVMTGAHGTEMKPD